MRYGSNLKKRRGKPKAGCIRLHPRQPKEPAHTLGRGGAGADDDVSRSPCGFLKSRMKRANPFRGLAGGGARTRLSIGWPMTAGTISAPSRKRPNGARYPSRRVQTRVALNPETLTAEESLYCSRMKLLRRWIELTASRMNGHWCQNYSAGAQRTNCQLGSDSRLAWVDTVSEHLFEAPDRLLSAFGDSGSPGLRLVIATPAKFQRGWLPSGFIRTKIDGEVVYQGQLRGIPHSEVILRELSYRARCTFPDGI